MSADEGRHRFCGNCGSPTQAGDLFCGDCGTSVSTPTQAEDAPQQAAAGQDVSQSSSSRPRGKRWLGAVALSLVLLLAIGAVGALALTDRLGNDRIGFLGGSGESSEDDVSDPAPAPTPPEETTTSEEPDLSYEDQEEAIIEEFVREYDRAVREEDWEETYSMLDDYSKEKFTEDEWAEAQKLFLYEEGFPYPIEGIIVDQNENVSDVPARVTLYYEDGNDQTIMAGVPMIEQEDGLGGPRRTLEDYEVEDLRELLEEDTTFEEITEETVVEETTAEEPSSVNDGTEEFLLEYYDAVEREDWAATYSMLADASQEEFTEDEWIEVQEIRQATTGAPPGFSSISDSTPAEEFVSRVEIVFEDGTTDFVQILLDPPTGEYQRLLEDEDISYLNDLLGGGSEDTGSTVEESIRAHYEAIGEGDFYTAYSYFGPTFRATNSEESWVAEEEAQGITGSTINSIDVASVSGDEAQAAVDVTFDDSSGTSSFYLGWNLVLEDGVWKLDAITVGGGTI